MTDPISTRAFEADGPVELSLTIGSGSIEVRLADEPGVTVTVRHAPGDASPLADLMSWVSGALGEDAPADVPAEAIRQTRIEFGAGRLVVRSPQTLPLRGVPLAVVVTAPKGSHVEVRAGSAPVTVTGDAGRVEATAVAAIRVANAAAVKLRSGGGDVESAVVAGSSSVHTGSGNVWLGTVTGDVMVRTGTGDVTIADAVSGQVELTSGSGDLRISVRADSTAEIDLSSGSGTARSELPLTNSRPESASLLRVRGRTGSGTAVIGLATT
ncbi:FIG00844639: hypothetical protein [Alloactinosynnema sp. L-07]|uniref:DUF4097 family beta strand repeat-containing protein n=1 Tax=Alloactinosynnema sp. L-07 TaxID=1653480 RepID=UPI00065F0252|nr:DUF4097 family beta strand repeat-containing protein [Alloactinosynnema sp. L-07]CRK58497.1 FIG00844639: hypothetical protein [Alloactinosynnema sp. L-07]